jgi:L-ascorbate metabolism protein UlaG (beta-lactamase superfamily)
LKITWVGHSTVLFEADGTRIITDPMLRRRVAHVRRVTEAPAPIGGELDAVLISHVHHDHLDVRSLRRLRARRIVVPRGAGTLVSHGAFAEVVEVEEGAEISLGDVTVVATRADHSARRWPFGREIPALGYLIRGSATAYFAGDTDLFDGMSGLAPDLDLALIPIDGWGPRVGAGHLDPRRGAEAVRRLAPRVAVPIHWGTYRRIGLDGDFATLREQAELFERLVADASSGVEVEVLPPGGSLEIPAAVRGAG